MPDKKETAPKSAATSAVKSAPNKPTKSKPSISKPSNVRSSSANNGRTRSSKSPSERSRASTTPNSTQATRSSTATGGGSGSGNATLDLLNQKLLAARLKKETELRRNRISYTSAKTKATTSALEAKKMVARASETNQSVKSATSLSKKSLPTLPLSASTAKKYALPFQENLPKIVDSASATKPLKLFKSPPVPASDTLSKGSGSVDQKQGKQSKTSDIVTPTKTSDSSSKPVLAAETGTDKIIEQQQPPQSGTSPQVQTNKTEEPRTAQHLEDVGTQSIPEKGKSGSGPSTLPAPEKNPVKQDKSLDDSSKWSDASQRSVLEAAAEAEESANAKTLKRLELLKPDEENDVWYYYSQHPIAIERPSHNQPKLRQRNNESILEMLRTVKDEQPQITIIPADESRVVEFEVAQWKEHRRVFLILFWIAFLMGITIIGLTVATSFMFYHLKLSMKATDDSVHFLMHTDPMIITNTFISGIGIVIFRTFPNIAKHTLVRVHVVVFTLVYILLTWAYIEGFVYHEAVTGTSKHMYSVHALVGVSIIGFLLWEAVTGVIIIFRPTSSLVKYHGVVGMITFMVCGACCVSGYVGRALLFTGVRYTSSPLKTALSNITGVLIIVFCCLVRYIATEFRFRRRSCPQWDTVFGRNHYPWEDENIDIPNQTLQKFVRMNLREGKKQG